jgi:hypothetical protein
LQRGLLGILAFKIVRPAITIFAVVYIARAHSAQPMKLAFAAGLLISAVFGVLFPLVLRYPKCPRCRELFETKRWGSRWWERSDERFSARCQTCHLSLWDAWRRDVAANQDTTRCGGW